MIKLLSVWLSLIAATMAYNYQEQSKGRQFILDAIRAQNDFCQNPSAKSQKYIDDNLYLRNVNPVGMNYQLYVYSSGDYMSESIVRTGAWELPNSEAILKLIEEYLKKKGITEVDDLTVLDLGANIGWFTFLFGLKGYQVVSFEPAVENVYILRKNLCLNPTAKVLLVNVGLGDVERSCKSYTDDHAFSNRWVYCNLTAPPERTYRGDVTITRLDNFAGLFTNIVFLKCDIEGYEAMAVSGGRKIFIESHIPFIEMEFVWDRLVERGAQPGEFLKEFVKTGYEIHVMSFAGPIIEGENLMMKASYPTDPDSVFLIYKGPS